MLLQVLMKIVLTICSKQNIGKVLFMVLHRMVKLTKNTKDDDLIDKLEKLYWASTDCTDMQSEDLLHKIREQKGRGNDRII